MMAPEYICFLPVLREIMGIPVLRGPREESAAWRGVLHGAVGPAQQRQGGGGQRPPPPVVAVGRPQGSHTALGRTHFLVEVFQIGSCWGGLVGPTKVDPQVETEIVMSGSRRIGAMAP